MGSAVCTLSQSGRHSVSLVVTNFFLLLTYVGNLLVMVALYVKFVLESHMAIVTGNHAGALAYFLLALGLILCVVCAASAKATYDAGSVEMATKRTCKMVLFTLACQGATLLLVLAAIIMCLVHKALLRGVLHKGFQAAIKLYRVNDRVKTGINRIQAGFHCCGGHSMDDWFKNPWIAMTHLDVDHPEIARRIVNGEFLTDDAPYSCCDVHLGRPCVHHQVRNLSAHMQLGPEGTLYTVGCGERLEDYWRSNVLNPILGILFLVACLLVVCMTLSRLLQTSLDEALDKGDPTADGDAFCIRGLPCFNTTTRPNTTIHVRHDPPDNEAE
ncbi:hypothetical protein ACOMHN_042152 [Nucella lapillus]